MLATVSLRKLGQDCVLSGPWLCRELGWIRDLQGRVWAVAAPCGPARPRARVAGLSGLSLTLLDPVGGGLSFFIFPAQPCVPTGAHKGHLWGRTGALKFAISLDPAASNKPTVLSSEYRRGDSGSEREMRATKPPSNPSFPTPCLAVDPQTHAS